MSVAHVHVPHCRELLCASRVENLEHVLLSVKLDLLPVRVLDGRVVLRQARMEGNARASRQPNFRALPRRPQSRRPLHTRSTKISDTNWTVRADLPTPPDPSKTILYSNMVAQRQAADAQQRPQRLLNELNNAAKPKYKAASCQHNISRVDLRRVRTDHSSRLGSPRSRPGAGQHEYRASRRVVAGRGGAQAQATKPLVMSGRALTPQSGTGSITR